MQVSKPGVVPLAEAQVATSGSKAAACAQLLQLAEKAGSGFKATTGVVFPFGSMDLAIKVSVHDPPSQALHMGMLAWVDQAPAVQDSISRGFGHWAGLVVDIACTHFLPQAPASSMTALRHCCKQDAKKVKKFQALVKEVEAAPPGEGLDEACEQLQLLVAELKPAKASLQAACEPHCCAGGS